MKKSDTSDTSLNSEVGNDNSTSCVYKDDTRCRFWFITVNSDIIIEDDTDTNILDDWTQSVNLKLLKLQPQKKVYQFEQGSKNNRLHFHLYIEFRNPRYFSAMKKNFPIGKIIIPDNKIGCMKYCVKERTRFQIGEYSDYKNPEDIHDEKKKKEEEPDPAAIYRELLLKESHIEEYYPWQKSVIDIIKNKPDARSIYWIYDPNGGNGKSYFSKNLLLRPEIYENIRYFSSGKLADVVYSIKETVENFQIVKTFIFDIPRFKKNVIDFELIENLKNGMLFSSKYESTNLIIPIPNIVIFSNNLPNTNFLSADRWKIFEIVDKSLVEKISPFLVEGLEQL